MVQSKTQDKVAYLSDPHLDFYIKGSVDVSTPKFAKQLNKYLDELNFPDDLDVIIVAGDLGHYNSQSIGLLKELRNRAKNVICVVGNHDLYLISEVQQAKYNYSSMDRFLELKESIKALDNIYLLDGDVIDINGTVYGGCSMWYKLGNGIRKAIWSSGMNDSRLIMQGKPKKAEGGWYGMGSEVIATFDSDSYYEDQVEKLKKIKCDVFISHVSPIKIPGDVREVKYRHNTMNFLYESDNMEALQATGAKTCIYGHTHTTMDYVQEGIRFLCNPIGYPGEKLHTKIKVI